ncbi:MAG TPA: M10 family metallopeptidase C-terminal domain-containing protein [Rhizomicrobium sp.]|nr:M10 family metallopeptidase C-terminal domain-containing protein [Rhizomicrobium sp.]
MAGLPEEVAYFSGVNADGTVASTTDAFKSKWGSDITGTSGGTVYYYFDPAANWNTTEQTMLAAGLALWSDVANINFVATADPNQAQIKFVRGASGTGAFTNVNYSDTSPNHTGGTAGGVYLDQLRTATISIDTTAPGYGPIDGTFTRYGGNPVEIFLHEEGHALGLGHAGPYNGSVNLMTQQFSPYDTQLWTIMSYINPRSTAEYSSQYPVMGTNWGPGQGGYAHEPTTWMPLDILGIQAIYGVATNTPLSGGQTFGFNCNIQGPTEMFFDFTKNTYPVITIWDSGTNNTLDLSGFSTASTVNLNPGTFSSCDGIVNNIAIAFNTAIDKVVCGAGNDIITGNNDGDTLIGGGGNDIITGGSGNDTISATGSSIVDGGAGIDTFVVNSLYSAGAITNQSGSSATVLGALLTNVEFVQFQDRTVQIGTPPPVANVVLTTSNVRATANQTLAASSLFSVTDSLGNPITAYQLWDATSDPNSGHFMVNGVAQAATTVINITAAQLAQTIFVTGSVADNIQIRATDGSAWSAPANTQWAPFTITPTVNHPPVVTTSTVAAARNQTLAASSLFTVSDPDGDTITEYQLWDGTADPLSGYFVVNGVVQAANTAIDITAAQLAQTSFVTGKVNDNLEIRAYDGQAWSAAYNSSWSPFTVTVPNTAPVLTTAATTLTHGQSVAVSSLFTVSDADGDSMTKYQLWDSTNDPNSGYFVVNGQIQPAWTVINITAAQLAQTSFVAGTVSDNLQIRAFDGAAWSAADNVRWAPFTVTVPANHAPVLTTTDTTILHGRSVAASSLFTVSDPDGDPITRYQLWDSTNNPNSGYFVVNGVVQPAWTVIDITAAQLAQTTFVAGTVSDNLQIRASDGAAWSAADNVRWAPFTVTVPPNHAPVLTTAATNLTHGQSVAASSLFTVSDADGDSMTKYQLWDSTNDPASGYFVVNGVVQPAWTVITITAAQLAQTSFVAGMVNDGIQIRAFDGADWSAADNARWSPFTVSVPPNHAPVLTTADTTILHGRSVGASSLFTVSDADGDAMTRYQLWDSTNNPNSGHFVVNGVAQPAWTVIDVTAAQLAQTTFVAGTVGDNLQIRAFDGLSWSAADNVRWSPFTVTVPANHAPVLTTTATTLAHGQSVAASSLFTVSDADGDSMTRYQLWDSTNDPNSGHFVVNGVAQPAWTVIDITAAQLAQTTFVAGMVNDGLQIRAYDGADWSAADNARWSPFTVSVPANHAPVLTTTDITIPHGQSVAASSLFTVSDTDGDAMTRYQLWDSTNDPNSGHFIVGGVAQSAWTVIDVTAAQLAQTSFVAGTVGDNLQIRAFDGLSWSAADTVRWAPFHVTAG